jgi:hypothetical protein
MFGMRTSGSATFSPWGNNYEWHRGFPDILRVNSGRLNVKENDNSGNGN